MAQPSHDATNALRWSRVRPRACSRIIVIPTTPPLVGRRLPTLLSGQFPLILMSCSSLLGQASEKGDRAARRRERCPMPSRKAPARRGNARARRAAPRPALPRLPELEQRQLDVIGLGLIALAVFFGFLVYASTDGGEAGIWTVDSLRWLLGAVHYGVPVALLAGGAILVLRPVLPAVRPFRAGALLLFAALCLALAAGTLGLGPDGGRPGLWDDAWVRTHGGMTGEALYWASSKLVGGVGADILAIFLFLAGVLLLTGASVAGVLKATTDSTTRVLRESTT